MTAAARATKLVVAVALPTSCLLFGASLLGCARFGDGAKQQATRRSNCFLLLILFVLGIVIIVVVAVVVRFMCAMYTVTMLAVVVLPAALATPLSLSLCCPP